MTLCGVNTFVTQATFGCHSLHLQQKAMINATLAGRDVFALMPTGGGKSLCYQPDHAFGIEVTLVILQLVSLGEDQVPVGIAAGIPTSGLKKTRGAAR